MDKYQKTLL